MDECTGGTAGPQGAPFRQEAPPPRLRGALTKVTDRLLPASLPRRPPLSPPSKGGARAALSGSSPRGPLFSSFWIRAPTGRAPPAPPTESTLPFLAVTGELQTDPEGLLDSVLSSADSGLFVSLDGGSDAGDASEAALFQPFLKLPGPLGLAVLYARRPSPPSFPGTLTLPCLVRGRRCRGGGVSARGAGTPGPPPPSRPARRPPPLLTPGPPARGPRGARARLCTSGSRARGLDLRAAGTPAVSRP